MLFKIGFQNGTHGNCNCVFLIFLQGLLSKMYELICVDIIMGRKINELYSSNKSSYFQGRKIITFLTHLVGTGKRIYE